MAAALFACAGALLAILTGSYHPQLACCADTSAVPRARVCALLQGGPGDSAAHCASCARCHSAQWVPAYHLHVRRWKGSQEAQVVSMAAGHCCEADCCENGFLMADQETFALGLPAVQECLDRVSLAVSLLTSGVWVHHDGSSREWSGAVEAGLHYAPTWTGALASSDWHRPGCGPGEAAALWHCWRHATERRVSAGQVPSVPATPSPATPAGGPQDCIC